MRRLLTTTLLVVAYTGCGGGSKPTGGCADPLMIDDMEDGDRFICASSGRTGAWYTITDSTSTNISPTGDFTQSLIPDGRSGSRHAAHMTGFGFTDWGAAMGFSLNGEGDAAQPYDASATGGVRFWMKSNVPVDVGFPIPETLATGAAAACVDDTRIWNCGNDFQFTITTPPPGTWKEYDVPFTAAAQTFRTAPDLSSITQGTARWDPSRLVAVQFGVYPQQPFDVWVDDVRFYSCAPTECVPTCTDPLLPVACPATSTTPASCGAVGTICAKTIAAFLPGVWGTGPSDVWTVGGGGTILHWNGTAWSAVPSGTTETLSAPWGTGPDDVWAVGHGGTILHWNGSTWSPSDSGTTELMFGVWGSGPDDVWATGWSGTILHWDGSRWSAVPSGTSNNLQHVWGSGPNDVWAVGTSTAGVIVHWDGTRWSPISGVNPAIALGVGGTGPTDVWITGDVIFHWDGSNWTNVPSGTEQGLVGTWANSPADAWAVGWNGTIVHWDGIAWLAVPSGTSKGLQSVWASGSNDAWAVGASGTIMHWDGAVWSVVPVEVP